ncbi:bifunctional 2-polyprenyl-6-hydroxyphenol methylase/3-demethylubiquinol 3-O-methyltransferase UbiG [Nocardioides sp. TF02-7]|uniref:bifunctional 2-polyprenyl-6-hydroxyphenol methylase/3-demethylubiquinol 3-O-methyltransferase UbiG n=1 Tax=Nocardioides sp. TF02-7 TaxID=2917724 RepID=UPI001F059F23|nr:bifunctional 2-polyprenyl-6-hydroxyphenol methylase/3-demethylubiquinol 3-O-methyltransferase UbiG [Nocardioides sp. TF02-7]UMG93058.1 bifunctional 2-polyprenyl-6-hydroxyphenol methylase/3-demethylubiquinol 3-O-methyltransferase UbiG [Nocardioides sp. TF02-7]
MIDNEVYDRDGAGWWDEDSSLNMLHGSMTPGRLRYFRGVLDRLRLDPGALRALDVGCGGGFLAEEFARLGAQVVGVDPSSVSIDTARRHAAEVGLEIDYRVGSGESLPVTDGEFDLVYCCDVLEHVSDLPRVLAEISRSLTPRGVFLFDTVNRTRASKMVAIKTMQEWRLTRIMDVPIHDWDMFITPDELETGLRDVGLQVREVVGLGPRANPLALVTNLRRAKAGKISYGELSRRLDFGQVRSTQVSYMGFAVKGA